MKLFKTLFGCALAAGLALAAPMPSVAADKLVITMDTAPGHLRTRIMKEFIAMLEKRSGGAMTFELFDSSQLYSSRDAAKAVARGDAGMTVLVTPILSRIVADFNVFDLPVINGLSDPQRAQMLDDGLGEFLGTQLEEKMGVVVPGQFWSMGKVLIFSTQKPMNSFEDLKGMKIRIPGGAALVMRLEAIGAASVAMPSTDLPLALQQGVVDATMAGAESVMTMKLTDAGVRYGFWDQGIIGYLAPLVSRKYWASLSLEQQAMFTEAWNQVTTEQRKAVLEEEAEHWRQLADLGVKMATASDEDVAQANKAMLAVQDKMIAKLGISADAVTMATKAATDARGGR
ncbi:MAG: TRAP transporter substrate-binding protein DctP [Burkholderiaceae bacterium]